MASKTVIRPIQIRPYPNNPALAINLTFLTHVGSLAVVSSQKNREKSFAVIGNNVQNQNDCLTVQRLT